MKPCFIAKKKSYPTWQLLGANGKLSLRTINRSEAGFVDPVASIRDAKSIC